MLSLSLLTVVGLVVVAATDPHDFSKLCSSPAPGGECPAGWKNVGGDCVKFMSGWDQAKTKEVCKEEGAELTTFGLVGEVCLVRRETQCQCGRTNRDREANIVGGGPAERNEYPWQVRLSSGCGGSIISRDKILTAAHCTEGYSVGSIFVFTRDHDRTREDGEVRHSVCSKKEHPEYSREAKYDKDIAILTLCKPLMFTEAVGPICLPDPAQDYDNVKALLTGWGTLSYGGQHPDILQEVNVTTITNQQCRGKHGHNHITDYMICAGSVGRGSCNGDSGGPLSVLGQDGRYSQIGIVSWGRGCTKYGYPGVYTRLTSLLDWVNQPPPVPGPQYLTVKSCGKGGKERYSSELGYYQQTSEYHNKKPVWSKQDGTMKIYYSYGSARVKGGFWTIGPDPATDTGNVASAENSQNLLPNEIREWQYNDAGTWYTDPFLTVTDNINFCNIDTKRPRWSD